MPANLFTSLESAPAGHTVATASLLPQLAYNSDGLIPAIAQDNSTGDVLMMAWMNQDSIEETLRTGAVCYWSRSRQKFWRKGEESGHVQTLVSMHADCDGDTLLLKVNQSGPACHTLRQHCFYVSIGPTDTRVSSNPETADQ
ncbi:MAG: phosphoribosyl-AMP cyclohydrolase [Pseudomonadaceae bacterium]|nr:phosphoribosyl-AMP cyclohydrolase [Pseudomonadaceae bacterium]